MKILKPIIITSILVLSTSANAALVGRLAATPGGTDYQAYYDTSTNLTWLADANYAKTSGYASADSSGRMTLVNAKTWAANLTVGGVGYWRLPTAMYPDSSCIMGTGSNGLTRSLTAGYDCTGSEMGKLFYTVLGGKGDSSIASVHNNNYNLFHNIQSSVGSPFSSTRYYNSTYWSSSYFPPDGTAWTFTMANGFQFDRPLMLRFHAWAVHTGDVSAVPIPATVWLFGSGLVGLIGVGRRKRYFRE